MGGTTTYLSLGRDGVAASERQNGGSLVRHHLAGARADAERWIELSPRLRLLTEESHPNVLPVFEAALDDESPSVATPGFDRSLLDVLDEGPLAEDALVALARAVCAALEFAHRLGLTAPDLSPETVGYCGGVIAVDLTSIETHGGRHRTSAICRAPEGGAEPSGDIYSLAALLHCASRGLEAMAPPEPISLAALPKLERMTARMLAIAPRDRPFLEEVRDCLGTSDDRTITSAEGLRRIGRYTVLGKIGEGAMGAVYRGRDEITGEVVAIKVLGSEIRSKSELVYRFRREARLLAGVVSPYVARFIDANSAGGEPYLVMEFLDGPSLASVIADRDRIPEDEALSLVADMARGLADIHAAGVIHRDIKPANVILVDDGGTRRAMLCDFGVARSSADYEATAGVTETGVAIGTPGYMSPEQCAGEDVSPRTDVFSLGASLYHMITGRAPFARPTIYAVFAAIMAGDYTPVEELVPQLRPTTIALIERALAHEPGHRFASAVEFLDMLESARRGTALADINDHPTLEKSELLEARVFTVELLLDATPSELWPYVSDTDRLNRAIGLGSVSAERTFTADRVDMVARSKALGFPIEWEEEPFEWVAPSRFGVIRRFSRGPVEWYRSSVVLEAQSSGKTLLTHIIDVSPRGGLGRLAVAIDIGFRTKRNLSRVYRRIERVIRSRRQHPHLAADPFEVAPPLSADAEASLTRIEEELVRLGGDTAVIEALGGHLREGSAMAISRIRPLEFAHKYRLDPSRCVETFLLAASLGALELQWDLLCPVCRVAGSMADALAELAAHSECESCATAFEVDLGESIELVFRSHPQIRPPDRATYCLGGPSHAPHVIAQIRLAEGERMHAELNLEAGAYTVTGRGLPRQWRFHATERSELSRLELALVGGITDDRARAVRAGPCELVLSNDLGCDALVRVERAKEDVDVLTASRVMCMPEFRHLFPGEVLSPGILFGISHIVAVVTQAETAPGREGFAEIAELRERLENLCHDEGGMIVRFVGRGFLAVFNDPSGAVRTAIELATQESLEARVAVASGSAMVATINQRLDYLGEAIDECLAEARSAEPGELAVDAGLLASSQVVELLDRHGLVGRTLGSQLRFRRPSGASSDQSPAT